MSITSAAVSAVSPQQFLEVLNADDRRILAAYVNDHLTQRQIAENEKRWQTFISFRLRRARQKLQAAGYSVVFPGRGRRRSKPRTVNLDVEALARLAVCDGVGRWHDGRRKLRPTRGDT